MGQNFLQECVFVTHLSDNVGILVLGIVWVRTNCCFMSSVLFCCINQLFTQHLLCRPAMVSWMVMSHQTLPHVSIFHESGNLSFFEHELQYSVFCIILASLLGHYICFARGDETLYLFLVFPALLYTYIDKIKISCRRHHHGYVVFVHMLHNCYFKVCIIITIHHFSMSVTM